MSTGQSIHTLLVEDPQEAYFLNDLISRSCAAQFTWQNVASLGEAQGWLRRQPFDLVLLDLFLADSQGLDTLQRLVPHAICLPIVVITNADQEPLVRQALRSGAQDCFVKGELHGEGFVQRLQNAIERKRVETALRVRNHQLSRLVAQIDPASGWQASDQTLAEVLVQELNLPLAQVSAQLEAVAFQFPPNDPRVTALDAIHAEIERMGQLVGSLLQESFYHPAESPEALRGQLQQILPPGGTDPQPEEGSFFEALGAWLVDYLSSHKTVPSLHKYMHPTRRDRTVRHEPISERELQVMRMIARGYTNKEIGQQLSLSSRTIERHAASVMKKLGLHKRAELIAYTVKQGIVNENDILESAHETHGE